MTTFPYYLVVSFPYFDSVEKTPESQFSAFQKALGDVCQGMRLLTVPTLKIGTLNSLMDASDELSKLDPLLENVSQKLIAVLEEVSKKPRHEVAVLRLNQAQEITGDLYLKYFNWNNAQYDVREPLEVLIRKMQQTANVAEERIRSVVSEYSDSRQKLQAAQRKMDGSLASRSINDLVHIWTDRQSGVVHDTVFLTTVFLAVPVTERKNFLSHYWELNEYVVPQSAALISEDAEFALYAVVVFKKVVEDFKVACRKCKYIIRDLDIEASSSANIEILKTQADHQRNSLLALLGQQFSLCYAAWIHVKVMRVFVESLLKYGLPPQFIPVLIALEPSKENLIRRALAKLFPDVRSQLGDEQGFEAGALQYEYQYVSLKITNLAKK